MLVFPELSKPEDYDHLNELVAPIERFFDEGGIALLQTIFLDSITKILHFLHNTCLFIPELNNLGI